MNIEFLPEKKEIETGENSFSTVDHVQVNIPNQDILVDHHPHHDYHGAKYFSLF